MRHATSAAVDIENSIVIDVAEIHAHWRHGAIEPDTSCDILKGAGSKIVVETRAARSLKLRTHRAQEDLGDSRAVIVDVEVQAAVVIVVPEPAGKAAGGAGHSELGSYVHELTAAFVVVEPALLAHVRDEQIESAVAIVITPG